MRVAPPGRRRWRRGFDSQQQRVRDVVHIAVRQGAARGDQLDVEAN